jgi:cobalamin synthase
MPGRRWILASVVTGLLYAVLASSTRPFTWAANIVTGVPVVAVGLTTAWTSRSVAPRPTDGRADAVQQHQPRWDRRWTAWVVLAAGVISWELYCLVSLPRAEHPTLSSLLDMLDSTGAGKSVAFASWLALGWFLVAR